MLEAINIEAMREAAIRTNGLYKCLIGLVGLP